MEESKEKVSMSEEKGKISGKSTGQCDKPGLRKLGIVSACSKIFGSK